MLLVNGREQTDPEFTNKFGPTVEEKISFEINFNDKTKLILIGMKFGSALALYAVRIVSCKAYNSPSMWNLKKKKQNKSTHSMEFYTLLANGTIRPPLCPAPPSRTLLVRLLIWMLSRHSHTHTHTHIYNEHMNAIYPVRFDAKQYTHRNLQFRWDFLPFISTFSTIFQFVVCHSVS